MYRYAIVYRKNQTLGIQLVENENHFRFLKEDYIPMLVGWEIEFFFDLESAVWFKKLIKMGIFA